MRFSDNMVDPKVLGLRIREARERKGLSQEEFASLISRDQRAVSEYEHGKRRLSATELPTLARVLDVPMLYFFDGDISPHDLDRAMLEELHRLDTVEARHVAIEMIRLFSDALEQRIKK